MVMRYQEDREHFDRHVNVLKFSPDDARYMLGMGVGSGFIWTVNLRSLRNFLVWRFDKAASWEIKKVAARIIDIFVEHDMIFLIKDVIG